MRITNDMKQVAERARRFAEDYVTKNKDMPMVDFGVIAIPEPEGEIGFGRSILNPSSILEIFEVRM